MKPNRLILLIAHLAGWLLFFGLVIGFVNRTPGPNGIFGLIASRAFIVFFLFYILFFYGNSYLLIPQLYLQRRYFLYVATILVLFAIFTWIRPFEQLMNSFDVQGERMPPSPGIGMGDRPPPPGPGGGNRGPVHVDIITIILFIAVWSLSFVLQLLGQWRQTEQRAVRAEADKANAELSFLKAQVNPHFLFNTLNNIYALAVVQSEQTADSILKLSNIMRYFTEEVHSDYVSLDDELNCLRDYIDLQRLRIGKKTRIVFEVRGDSSQARIAPLVLMTFVENAFKYGISNHEESFIRMELKIEGDAIRFFCQNRLFAQARQPVSTGIGIDNTRHRLQHLYPNRHQLTINKENGFYTVELSLQA